MQLEDIAEMGENWKDQPEFVGTVVDTPGIGVWLVKGSTGKPIRMTIHSSAADELRRLAPGQLVRFKFRGGKKTPRIIGYADPSTNRSEQAQVNPIPKSLIGEVPNRYQDLQSTSAFTTAYSILRRNVNKPIISVPVSIIVGCLAAVVVDILFLASFRDSGSILHGRILAGITVVIVILWHRSYFLGKGRDESQPKSLI
jgi:hypothetical protein